MRAHVILWLAVWTALLMSTSAARTRIIVVPRDAFSSSAMLFKHIAGSVAALRSPDKLMVYAANPVERIATIEIPTDPKLNRAQVNAAIAEQFRPVKEFFNTPPRPAEAEPPQNLAIPYAVEDLGRNLLPSLPDRGAEILLVGSWLFWDRRDAKSVMTERLIPSDSTLRAPRADWPFSVVGAETRLSNTVVHFCWPNGQAEVESARHEEKLRRWWSIWTAAQGGRVATMSFDAALCFHRFNIGESSGQPAYQPSREGKPEMQRVSALVPAALPANFDSPSAAFLRDDAPISKTPPANAKGIAWIGIKWNASPNCDLDLYVRGETTSPWLYFGNMTTAEGRFNKDWTSATGEIQYEFAEFSKPIDLNIAQVSINIYSCESDTAPEGKIRVWFSSRIFEQPFKMPGKTGSKGGPMTGASWLRIDLRKVVGIIRD